VLTAAVIEVLCLFCGLSPRHFPRVIYDIAGWWFTRAEERLAALRTRPGSGC